VLSPSSKIMSRQIVGLFLSLALIGATAHADEACVKTTTPGENVALIKRFYHALQTHDYSDFDHLVAVDFMEYQLAASVPGITDPHVGREGLRQAFVTILDRPFPDLFTKIEDIIVSDDKVVVRSINTGTHRGAFLGIAASGRKVKFASIDINQICGGLLSKTWHLEDWLTVRDQIAGTLPVE